MKALEILKRILKTPQDLFRYSDLELETAIAELETMQDIILEKEESLDIERFMFKNKLEELNNRSCKSCNYYTGTVCYYHEGWCDEIGVVHPVMEKNDCCNRYEKKDSE